MAEHLPGGLRLCLRAVHDAGEAEEDGGAPDGAGAGAEAGPGGMRGLHVPGGLGGPGSAGGAGRGEPLPSLPLPHRGGPAGAGVPADDGPDPGRDPEGRGDAGAAGEEGAEGRLHADGDPCQAGAGERGMVRRPPPDGLLRAGRGGQGGTSVADDVVRRSVGVPCWLGAVQEAEHADDHRGVQQRGAVQEGQPKPRAAADGLRGQRQGLPREAV